MRQTAAILLDAYRELNAKKLFWITLIISALVVIAFALVRLTPTGIKVIAWEVPSPFNLSIMTNAAFYKLMFQSLGVNFWLSWAAGIIGLIVTCSMIPDFVASGSIELTLSKPIARARLFLTKFLAGMMFTVMQVGVFSVAAFLLIGIRGGEWNPRILLAIPVVSLMFSYLFSVCALVGMVTRSAIFSLIATLLVWLLIFAVHTVETGVMLQLRVAAELNVQRAEARLERFDKGQPVDEPEKPKKSGLMGTIVNAVTPKAAPPTREELQSDLDSSREDQGTWTRWHRGLFVGKTLLPKTAETTGLLQRWLFAKDELLALQDDQLERQEAAQARMAELRDRPQRKRYFIGSPVVAQESMRRVEQRSVAWVIGTSLMFEAVLLASGCWLFVRKDF